MCTNVITCEHEAHSEHTISKCLISKAIFFLSFSICFFFSSAFNSCDSYTINLNIIVVIEKMTTTVENGYEFHKITSRTCNVISFLSLHVCLFGGLVFFSSSLVVCVFFFVFSCTLFHFRCI